jgi:hypothetical protein
MEAVLALGFMLIASVTYVVQGEVGVVPAITLFAAAGLRLLPIVNRVQGLVLQLVADILHVVFVMEPPNISPG